MCGRPRFFACVACRCVCVYVAHVSILWPCACQNTPLPECVAQCRELNARHASPRARFEARSTRPPGDRAACPVRCALTAGADRCPVRAPRGPSRGAAAGPRARDRASPADTHLVAVHMQWELAERSLIAPERRRAALGPFGIPPVARQPGVAGRRPRPLSRGTPRAALSREMARKQYARVRAFVRRALCSRYSVATAASSCSFLPS